MSRPQHPSPRYTAGVVETGREPIDRLRDDVRLLGRLLGAVIAVPLVAVVSEPDMLTAEEARAYFSELRAILEAVGGGS